MTNHDKHQKHTYRGSIVMLAVIGAITAIACYFIFIRPPVIHSAEIVEEKIAAPSSLESVAVMKQQNETCYSQEYVNELLVFTQLKTSQRGGKTIPELIDELSQLPIKDAKLKTLNTTLQSTDYLQIASLNNLQRGLDLISQKILSNPSDVTEDSGWFSRYLRKLIVIRKTGERALNTGGVEGQLARARAALTKGDVADAVSIINSMPDAQKSMAKTWLGDATNKLQIQTTIDEMYDVVAGSEYRNNFSRVCKND